MLYYVSNYLNILNFINIAYMVKNQITSAFGVRRENVILELVHNDLLEHVAILSIGIILYHVSFIDDISRNTWIYFAMRNLISLVNLNSLKYNKIKV